MARQTSAVRNGAGFLPAWRENQQNSCLLVERSEKEDDDPLWQNGYHLLILRRLHSTGFTEQMQKRSFCS
jgi:hypothetical protein